MSYRLSRTLISLTCMLTCTYKGTMRFVALFLLSWSCTPASSAQTPPRSAVPDRLPLPAAPVPTPQWSARHERSSSQGGADGSSTKSTAVLRLAFDKANAYDARLTALDAIGQARLVGLLPLVESSLADPEHDVRLAAIEALAKLPHPRARVLLESVRDDTTEALELRVLAAAFLLSQS